MKVAGVLLGAGQSSRFGSSKLEAHHQGRRLVDIACGHFLDAGLDPVVFCGPVGPEDPRVKVVEGGPTMIDSLRRGLEAIPDMAFAFAPADLPGLDPALIRNLAEAFQTNGKRFLVPVHGGRGGHPAFARDKELFFRLGDEAGAREVWRAAKDDLVRHEVDTAAILWDIDTPGDLVMHAALKHLDANKDRYLELLLDYLRIPSISAQKEYAHETRRAAEWIRGRLEEAGLEAGIYEGDGLPTVHGSRIEGEDLPTILVYGHYDVQPPEPLELWETPPFEPTILDGEIRARGCADDKGPSLAMVLAAECLVNAGGLGANLTFVLEGEEECGGHVVEQYLKDHRDRLAADTLVVADSGGLARGTPALCYGLRGLVAAEVKMTGPGRDLHSGGYGGTVANPATAIARLVASLHDDTGCVAVEGFYDGILPADENERARAAALPFDEAAWLEETGSPSLFGEEGYTTLERKSARPTCEINGIFSGYMGEGVKTIVPADAGCKITCRLVPGQDPAHVFAALEAHLTKHCPAGVRLEVEAGHMAPAVYTDPETKWARAARGAMEKAFGEPAALMREGGSIPVVNAFTETLGVQPLLLGTYAPGEKAHSPNERYFVDDFYAGIRTGIALFSACPP